jgi:hypothetical protein
MDIILSSWQRRSPEFLGTLFMGEILNFIVLITSEGPVLQYEIYT